MEGSIEMHTVLRAKLADHYIPKRKENNEGCSQLISDDHHPSIYNLNARECSNGTDFRWFEICEPVEQPDLLPQPDDNRSSREHKVIILMGATGSGKSTLINGMVNYILGVEWTDSYRFTIIREDEGAGRNQAHSQTSSVTAYTLHHRPGMTISHSITIIDTPGYGDTRGIQKDEEITRTIQRFLIENNKDRFDSMHVVCFVTASGDSKLSHTQRYILDSMQFIFGNNVKDNIRLLVTFADNSDPQVIEGCREAGVEFPYEMFSKFNSCVNYTSNRSQYADEDLNFEQLFWDTNQENFKKFFDMLESMNGLDLKSISNINEKQWLEAQQQEEEQEDEIESYMAGINADVLELNNSHNQDPPDVALPNNIGQENWCPKCCVIC